MARNNQHWVFSLMAATFCFVAAIAAPATAALIPSFPAVTNPGPDMYSDLSSIEYNAGTDTFTIIGIPQQFVRADNSLVDDFLAVPAASFNITANITSTGAIGGLGGTLAIVGRSQSINNADLNLLSGATLDEFGFTQVSPGTGRFQFVFSGLTGLFASQYETGKAYVLVLASSSGSSFDGTFQDDDGFSFLRGSLSSDTFGVQVPEPGSALMALLSCIGLAVTRARRRKV
jgi:hypothetical protein